MVDDDPEMFVLLSRFKGGNGDTENQFFVGPC